MTTPDSYPVPDSPSDEATPAPTEHVVTRSKRVLPGTIVWGLVVAVLGTAVIAWGQGLRFDLQLAAIGLLAAAGLVLVATSLSRSRSTEG